MKIVKILIGASLALWGASAQAQLAVPMFPSTLAAQASGLPNVDQNATAFAGVGSVLGTPVISNNGSGSVVSAEINVSALTLGGATSVIFCLEQSTGGTNFSDVWCGDPVTATGTYIVPPVTVSGKRLWRVFNVGGTSTTVTATISALELPTGSYPFIRQSRDAYAASNPFATRYNSAALTASTFVLTTVTSTTTPMYVGGTKLISGFITLAGAPTVTTQPVVAMDGSQDGVNFIAAIATATAAGNGTYGFNYSAGTFQFVRFRVTTAAAYSSGSYTIANIGVNAVN